MTSVVFGSNDSEAASKATRLWAREGEDESSTA